MDISMHIESINLVKSLQGRYKQKDKEMLLELLENYKEQKGCSYRYAYEKLVEGNPSYSTYMQWRQNAIKKSSKLS